jgi:gliding motility-associated-like protein
MKIKQLIIFLILLSSTLFTYATHNRAGEITYRHISGLRFEATITTYTKASSFAADRPELEILWGDGDSDILPRVNGNGVVIGNDIKMNIYIGEHTYRGPGNFVMSMEDPNRNGNINNIPSSINVRFYIETTLVISPFGATNYNNSPQLLNPPIDDACIGKKFIHNPGAFDSDGDSLSYELTDCKATGGASITGYVIPPNVSINPVTGDLLWNTPLSVGEFNFAILIKEWRRTGNNVVNVGNVLRDLQVTVGNCNNDPPAIANLADTCVVAGGILVEQITASDPNNDLVTLTALGSPFLVNSSPASFQSNSGVAVVSSVFNWQTNCTHVRQQPYNVLFRAADNGFPNLTDYKTWFIKIIAPATVVTSATPLGSSINLVWNPNTCNQATSYKIYRRQGSFGFVPSHCETGVPAYTGYVQIAQVPAANNTFSDNDNGAGLEYGEQYCYMIVAVFPDGSESIASQEICAELKKDIPVITHVSVEETDSANGKMLVAWSKPTQLDLTQFTGPFSYKIYRREAVTGSSLQLIHSTPQSPNLNDTTFVDSLINTRDKQYYYRIDLVDYGTGSEVFIGNTRLASSVFLKITPFDRRLNLKWNFDVPWNNTKYTIFKYNNQTSTFDSLTTLNNIKEYTDSNLVNLVDYCYYVKASGQYTSSSIISPLINLSQETCQQPIDLEPPCSPTLLVDADCDNVENSLSWNNPNETCGDDDTEKYYVYFKPSLGDTFTKVAEVYGANNTTFKHNYQNKSIAGCYYISAVDSVGNESLLIDSVCIDNCIDYVLPNVFSPDGDGINDFFRAFKHKYIESVEFNIYNRWGLLLYQTNNSDVMWDGTNTDTGLPVPDGVYFYTAIVNEIRLEGIVPVTINGFFHLFRNADLVPQPPQ